MRDPVWRDARIIDVNRPRIEVAGQLVFQDSSGPRPGHHPVEHQSETHLRWIPPEGPFWRFLSGPFPFALLAFARSFATMYSAPQPRTRKRGTRERFEGIMAGE